MLPHYPYRDQARMLWDTIHTWVDAYLRLYYEDDAGVQADPELQAWAGEIVARDGGRVKGFGQNGKIETLAYLTDAATLLIFTASVQHAAVNFPQFQIMSFAPKVPLAVYAPPPASKRVSEADYLKALGATIIMDRKELTEAADRPLLSERFAGVVDTVSGVMFARALAQVKYGGAAAVCGLAAGPAFPGSILPFILRSVTVYGIDSVMLPKAPREEAWRRLGTDLPLDKLDRTVSEVALSDLMALAPRILKGEVRGRVVVDVKR